MADVQQNRQRYALPEPAPGGQSVKASVVAFAVVLAAIALLMFQPSRRHASRPPAQAAAATVEPPLAPPADPPVAAPALTPAPAAAAAAEAAQDAQDEAEGPEGTMSAQKQSGIERVVANGGARLKACYQRALVRDDSLVNGHLTVQVAVAASGRVQRVHISGPAAFRVLDPCLHSTVSRWTFPTAAAPYTAEFMLAFRGDR